MKIVEINTPQNVVIQYECAELKDRVIAFVIDFVIIMCAIQLLRVFGSVAGFYGMAETIWEIIVVLCFSFYTLLCEYFMRGQTPGKRAMSIRVVKTDGQVPDFTELLSRWTFRLVDIYLSFGSIASILVGSSAKGQRLGDIVANTVLIKTKATHRTSLADILSIHSTSTYTPTYIEVKKLSENDMLTVKATLDRYKRYGNTAHKEAMQLLCEKLKEKLGLAEIPEDRKAFLTTLIQDYVVLTR